MRALALAALPVWLAAAPANVAVGIDNFQFGPDIAVPVGTTVVWTNHDDIPHTVTGADGAALLHSGPLDTDEHFAHRFDRPGRYVYFCSLHAHMKGAVVVR